MGNIRGNVKRGTVYESVAQYAADWRLLFENARTYNEDGSQIVRDTYTIEDTFNNALQEATKLHGIALEDDGSDHE